MHAITFTMIDKTDIVATKLLDRVFRGFLVCF